MSQPRGPLPSFPASRLAAPRWLDTRFVLGLLLVLAAVVAGSRLMASADRFSRVYVASRPLTPGERIVAGDLSIGRIRFHGQGGQYVAASGRPPIGYLVTRYVAPHELVPLAALAVTPSPGAASRLVTVPVQPGHLPATLSHGDLVDVYLTPKAAAGATVPPPAEVLSAVPVDSYDGGARSFGGGSTVSVVLAVPLAKVPALVHAVESGVIDLARVPATAVASVPGTAPADSSGP